MKMTIYLPDDLAEMVKEHTDLNVSAVCQDALRRELTRREELAKLDKGMERIEVYDGQFDAVVAFTGTELYSGDRPEETVYLTKRHRIAVYSHEAQALYQYDSFDDLAQLEVYRDGRPEVLAAVAAALGEEHVIELDI